MPSAKEMDGICQEITARIGLTGILVFVSFGSGCAQLRWGVGIFYRTAGCSMKPNLNQILLVKDGLGGPDVDRTPG